MRRWALPAIVLLGLAVRLPFWAEALRTPVDGDTAIIGLMARHPLRSTTMWGQPYGSPVEAWLAAPVLAVFGQTMPALRLTYFLLGLALVPLAAWLGSTLDRRAALPAALLMACPSPYFLLLSALPPPLYPTTLLLCGLLLVVSIRIGQRLEEQATSALLLVVWGAVAGLALWTHLMSATVVVAAGLYLLRRVRHVVVLLPAAVALVVASAPLWWLALREANALRVVSLSGHREGMIEHLRTLLPEMHRPLAGLLGAHVPWIADDPHTVAFAPTWVAVGVVVIYAALLFAAARASGLRGAPGLLLATFALVVVAFPLPLRASASAIRFLTPAYLPVVALVTWVAVKAGNARRGVIVALTLAALHMLGGLRLLGAWRGANRAEYPFLLPDLTPVRRELDALGIRRAYASYGPAYRLTFESGERLIVSQPWNERFLHYPMPYLDEVRFSPTVAWVFLPGVPTDLPSPREWEDQLGAVGGTFKRVERGPAVIFHSFVPPFGPRVVPLPAAGRAGHGDDPVTWPVTPPRPLAGVTLVATLNGPRLPRGLDLEVSGDGVTFERVVRRRRREERRDLRWVDGHPQYVVDDDLVATALGGRTVAAIRMTPVDAGEWAIGEVLLHEVDARGVANAAWDEWLDPNLGWPERLRALTAQPRRDREDWYYRLLLAERHR